MPGAVDQTPNLGEYPRSAWSQPGVGPFPRDQFAMPSKNGVGRDKRRHVSQYGASEPLPEHRETPPLPIVQVQPASRQLGSQHAILLPKKHDHIALLSLEPSEQRDEEHLERKHAVSLRQCIARVFRHYEFGSFWQRRLERLRRLGREKLASYAAV